MINKVKTEAAVSKRPKVLSGILILDIAANTPMTERQQEAALALLESVAKSTETVANAASIGTVHIYPRPNGKLLVFSLGVLPALEAATQIYTAVREQAPFEVRMGVHNGSVRPANPLMPKAGVVGEGVDTAQRVMDCGDANHILLSREAAELGLEEERWVSLVHFAGNCEVQHDVVIPLFNLYGTLENGNRIGNDGKPSRIVKHEQGYKFISNPPPPNVLEPLGIFLRRLVVVGCLVAVAVVGYKMSPAAIKMIQSTMPVKAAAKPKSAPKHTKNNGKGKKAAGHSQPAYVPPSEPEYTPDVAEDAPVHKPSRSSAAQPRPQRLMRVPDFSGDTVAAARAKASRNKVQISTESSGADNETVYSQDPAAGERVPYGTVISLYLGTSASEPGGLSEVPTEGDNSETASSGGNAPPETPTGQSE